MLNNAVYGRMRPGRCITGSFNTGCSMSATYYVDSHCSGKQFCDMSVRHLVDIHPCQRDFMSYLEASYSCIDGKWGWILKLVQASFSILILAHSLHENLMQRGAHQIKVFSVFEWPLCCFCIRFVVVRRVGGLITK